MEFKMCSDELDEKLLEIHQEVKSNWEYMYKLTDHLQKQIEEIKITLKHLIK